jgi:hypothetical protein
MVSDLQPTKYVADDEGNPQLLMRCQAPPTLHLKVGSRVILIRNLNNKLVNETLGTVAALNKYSVDVAFEGQNGTSTVTPMLFTVFDKQQWKNVASRRQLPL